jgi:hypothetical protein
MVSKITVLGEAYIYTYTHENNHKAVWGSITCTVLSLFVVQNASFQTPAAPTAPVTTSL